MERQTIGVKDFTPVGTFMTTAATYSGIHGEKTYLYQVRSAAGKRNGRALNCSLLVRCFEYS